MKNKYNSTQLHGLESVAELYRSRLGAMRHFTKDDPGQLIHGIRWAKCHKRA